MSWKNEKLTYTFDFNGKYGYTRMLRRQTEGKNNSWAIRWNASLFLKDILSLNVGKSLIQNNGFDGSGTKLWGRKSLRLQFIYERIASRSHHSGRENLQARQAYVNYYARTNSFMAKAIRRIKRTLKRRFRSIKKAKRYQTFLLKNVPLHKR